MYAAYYFHANLFPLSRNVQTRLENSGVTNPLVTSSYYTLLMENVLRHSRQKETKKLRLKVRVKVSKIFNSMR